MALQKLAYQSEARLYDDYSLQPLTQTLPEMQAQFADHLILKAERLGAMIGSVRGLLRGDNCLVGRLIVHPTAQRQGLGTSLMHDLEVHFPPQAARFELFTGHKSAGNLRLYSRLGYREFDRHTTREGLMLVFMEKIRPDKPGQAAYGTTRMFNVVDGMTERLLDDAGIGAGMRVIDIGCGPGEVSFTLARWVDANGMIYGVDRDAAMLALARERLRQMQ